MDFSFIAIFVLILLASFVANFFFMRQAMKKELGRDAASELLRQRRPVFYFLFIFLFLMVAGIIWLPIPQSFSDWLDVLFLLVVCVSVPVRILLRRRLGRVLALLPWSWWNKAMMIGGVALIILGTVGCLLLRPVRLDQLIFIAMGILFASTGMIRPQIREGGIVALSTTLRWNKIRSYQWQEGNKRWLLKIETTRPSPWRSGFLTVLEDQRTPVSDILDARIARSSPAT